MTVQEPVLPCTVIRIMLFPLELFLSSAVVTKPKMTAFPVEEYYLNLDNEEDTEFIADLRVFPQQGRMVKVTIQFHYKRKIHETVRGTDAEKKEMRRSCMRCISFL